MQPTTQNQPTNRIFQPQNKRGCFFDCDTLWKLYRKVSLAVVSVEVWGKIVFVTQPTKSLSDYLLLLNIIYQV